MKKIKIDISDLTTALEAEVGMGEYFLDRKSGKIILISEFVDCDAEQKRIAAKPENFLCIEPLGSGSGWDTMAEFVQTVEDLDIRHLLQKALEGRKPFRAFKDQLLDFPDIRKQWFAYQEESMKKLAKEWLEENEIDFEVADS